MQWSDSPDGCLQAGSVAELRLPEGALFSISAGGNTCRIGTPVQSFMGYHMAAVQINSCRRSVMRPSYKTVTGSTAA